MTKHALRQDRIANRRTEAMTAREAIAESLIVDLDYDAPARPANLDYLHQEALEINSQFDFDRLFSDYDMPEMDWEDDLLGGFDDYDERDDHYFDQDEDLDHWIPFVGSLEACREVFGGGDFIITHEFRERRTNRPMPRRNPFNDYLGLGTPPIR